MTLCLAVKSYDSYEGDVAYGTVITCHDYRVETATASAEIGLKWRAVSPDWSLMMAGNLPLAVELVELYKDGLARSTRSELPIERLRRPLELFRKRLAEQFTQSRYALTYDEFLRDGRTWLGVQLFREALFDLRGHISELERAVQLLFVGLDDEDFLRIFKYSSGELWECDSFAAIGSGETIAEAALYQRGHTQISSIAATAYRAYEAKRLGEVTPGVGRATSMTIIEAGPRGIQWRAVGPVGLKFLEMQFVEKFGPRPYRPMKLPRAFLSEGIGFWALPEDFHKDPSLGESSAEEAPTESQSPSSATTSDSDQT